MAMVKGEKKVNPFIGEITKTSMPTAMNIYLELNVILLIFLPNQQLLMAIPYLFQIVPNMDAIIDGGMVCQVVQGKLVQSACLNRTFHRVLKL